MKRHSVPEGIRSSTATEILAACPAAVMGTRRRWVGPWLLILGPGLMVMLADTDAGSLITAAHRGPWPLCRTEAPLEARARSPAPCPLVFQRWWPHAFRPEWRHRYQPLLARGRAKKEALMILSRSVLKVIYHLLRTSASYDPAGVFPGQRA